MVGRASNAARELEEKEEVLRARLDNLPQHHDGLYTILGVGIFVGCARADVVEPSQPTKEVKVSDEVRGALRRAWFVWMNTGELAVKAGLVAEEAILTIEACFGTRKVCLWEVRKRLVT